MADDLIRRTLEPETTLGPDPVEKLSQVIRAVTANGGKTASGAKSEARNVMLEALVYGDNDLVGLVAYAMHEVNRRDWCQAYETAHGRPPAENELKAYLVGEQLERRLDTYRRLAEDSLAKVALGDVTMRRLSETVEAPRGGSAASTPMTAALLPAPNAKTAVMQPAPPKKKRMGALVLYLLMLLIAVVIVAVALRNGIDLASFGK